MLTIATNGSEAESVASEEKTEIEKGSVLAALLLVLSLFDGSMADTKSTLVRHMLLFVLLFGDVRRNTTDAVTIIH